MSATSLTDDTRAMRILRERTSLVTFYDKDTFISDFDDYDCLSRIVSNDMNRTIRPRWHYEYIRYMPSRHDYDFWLPYAYARKTFAIGSSRSVMTSSLFQFSMPFSVLGLLREFRLYLFESFQSSYGILGGPYLALQCTFSGDKLLSA